MSSNSVGNGHGAPERKEDLAGLVVAHTHIGPKPRCPWCGRDQEGGIFLMKGRRDCEHCNRPFFYCELWSPDHTLVYVTCPSP